MSWPAHELGVRKRMRKGTRSCSECRRRKIRCVFPTAHPIICIQCTARGARCIDQEHAEVALAPDRRKNLRERVAELEALLESLTRDGAGRDSARSRSTADALSEPAPGPTSAVETATAAQCLHVPTPRPSPAENGLPHSATASSASPSLDPRLKPSAPTPSSRSPGIANTRNPGPPHLINVDFSGVEITPPASRTESASFHTEASSSTSPSDCGGVTTATRNPGPPHLINVDFSSLHPPASHVPPSNPPPFSPVRSTIEGSMTQESRTHASHPQPALPGQRGFQWHGGYACGMLF